MAKEEFSGVRTVECITHGFLTGGEMSVSPTDNGIELSAFGQPLRLGYGDCVGTGSACQYCCNSQSYMQR